LLRGLSPTNFERRPLEIGNRHAIAIALSVVMLDAATKLLAGPLASSGFGHGLVVPLKNPGFSLGVASAPVPIVLALASIGILCFGGYTAWQANRHRVPVWVPGLLIGGAVANVLDRLLFGAVHDWLYLPKVAVNLADTAVIIGAVGYFLTLQHLRREPKRLAR
jgi:lipoprotein signal peptidase